MKHLVIIFFVFLSTEGVSQYNYGLEVENKDAKIEGSLNIFDPNRADNVYIGKNAGLLHNIGNATLIIGSDAGDKLDLGSRNVFLGINAGRNIVNGFDNIFIGADAGFGFPNANISSNIRIGAGQVTQLDMTNSIAIGNSIGLGLLNVEQSNRLTIESELFETGYALLFGEFDTDRLGINWQVKSASGQYIPLPATLSVNGTLHISETVKLEPQSSAPSSCNTTDEYGLIYYDNSTSQHTLKLCTNTGWVDLN